jgi:2-methylcitrate dehydratase PrpD
VFGGHTGSHAFLGASVQNGMSLGLSAVAGLAARPGSVEAHLLVVAGAAPTPVDEGWDDHEVLGGYLKAHPTCAHLHGVNDAVEDLVAGGLDADAVDSVQVDVFAGAAGFDRVADSELAARFSIPTSVAVALVTGRLDATTMTDEVVRSSAVRDLAARVQVRHDPDLDAGYPDGRPARVTVVLADRSVHVATTGRPRWDADRRPPADAVAAKARRLVGARLGTDGAAVVDAFRTAPDDRPVAALGALLRRP